MPNPRRYALKCQGGGKTAVPPALAVFDVDAETAKFIVRMAKLAMRHGLFKIERIDCAVTWLEKDPRKNENNEINADSLAPHNHNVMPSVSDTLCVDDGYFWYTCRRVDYSSEFGTEVTSVAKLAEHFSIPFKRSR